MELITSLKTENNLLRSIRKGGTRVNISETIYLVDLDNKKVDFSSSISLKDAEQASNLSSFTKEARDYFINEVRNSNGIGTYHLFVFQDKLAILRTLHQFQDENYSHFPKILYNLWFFGETETLSEVKVQLKIPFSMIGIGKRVEEQPVCANKFPLPRRYEKEFSDTYFTLDSQNKMKITFDHFRSNFYKVELKIQKDVAEFLYSEKLRPPQDKKNVHFPDLFIHCKTSFVTEPEFSNIHYKIKQDDWIASLAILSSHFSPKEKSFFRDQKFYRKNASFSRIHFFDKNSVDNSNPDDEIWFLNSMNYEEEEDDSKYSKIKVESSSDSDRLEELIASLLLHTNNDYSQYETIFVLPQSEPKLSILSTSFIRYFYGYPIIYDDKMIDRMLNKNFEAKFIYFVKTQPTEKELKILENHKYKMKFFEGKNNQEVLFNLQLTFLKVLCLDSLLASYSIFPKNIFPTNTANEVVEDTLTERKNIVQNLDSRIRENLHLVTNRDMTRFEFFDIMNELYSLVKNSDIADLLDLGQFISDFRMEFYENEIKARNPGNLSGIHIVLYDSSLDISFLIVKTIYTSYKGLISIPMDLNQVKNISSENIITVYRKKYDALETRTELIEYGKKISKVLVETWVTMFDIILGKSEEIKKMKLNNEVGFGYCSLFLPSSGILLESMLINKEPLGLLFSVGRFPSDNCQECLNLVSNSFLHWIVPRYDPYILSIDAVPNRYETEYITHITSQIFPVLKKVDSTVCIMSNPTNKKQILEMIRQTRVLFLWGHGGQNHFTFYNQEGKKFRITSKLLEESEFLRPGVAILNSCKTGGLEKESEINRNMAITLIKKGFMGVCAPFWIIDTITAADGNFSFLAKLFSGYSLASITRHTKYHKKQFFSEVYVYYGDPEYNIDTYYPQEQEMVLEVIQDLIDNPFKASNGRIIKSFLSKN